MSSTRDPAASSAEEALLSARRSKAEAIRQGGETPFANALWAPALDELGAVRRAFEGARVEGGGYDAARAAPIAAGLGEVHVAGRVLALRPFKKASFLKIRERTGEMQLFCRAEVLGEGPSPLDNIDLGDHVEALGAVILTKTGELSVDVRQVRVLTKALRPLPSQYFGLSDVEQRYRQRYVDLVVNPGAMAVFRARSVLVRALRRYLDDADFLEVETPTLHPLIGGAAARPFETHHNALDMHLFLRIAPELYLKRLVVGGIDRVYEIGRTYRNEGISTRHNPEFTMLEFYEAYATYETIMARVEALLREADAALEAALPEAYRGWLAERPFTLKEPFARVPMREAVRRALEKASLPGDVAEQIRAEGAPIKEWAARSERAKKKIDWSNYRKAAAKCESAGEALFVGYEYLAEPFLRDDYRAAGEDRSLPVFIIDYPFEVSPLARRKDSDPSLVDRFELFLDNRELCNAFSELNDPDDQAARFRAQVAKKVQGEEDTMDYDADYIRALEHGMPPAAGFGMGVDRLVMALTNQPSLRDVILFPLMRPEQS